MLEALVGLGLVGLAASQDGWSRHRKGEWQGWVRRAEVWHRPEPILLRGRFSIARVRKIAGPQSFVTGYELLYLTSEGEMFELARFGIQQQAI